MALRLVRFVRPIRTISVPAVRAMSNDGWGSGAGKGGGSGGSVRDAGGAFGKMEAAREEEYFRRKQKEQLEALKDSLKDEIKFHKKQIHDHEEAIDRHKKKIGNLHKMDDD